MRKEGMPAYIYPRWLVAKRKLIEKLSDPLRSTSIAEVVDGFFRACVFEVGTEYKFNPYEWEKMAGDKNYETHITARLVHDLAEELYMKGCYMSDTTTRAYLPNEYPSVTRTVRVLVFASPEITGPGTREARDERS